MLLDLEIRWNLDVNVTCKPQNAYAKGWSVETVMHEVVGYIEKTPTLV